MWLPIKHCKIIFLVNIYGGDLSSYACCNAALKRGYVVLVGQSELQVSSSAPKAVCSPFLVKYFKIGTMLLGHEFFPLLN